MEETSLKAALADLPLGGLRYFPRISSTNDESLSWASGGAADLSLVVADEQTAGRGRAGRVWLTPPGAALAVSMVLRPTTAERRYPGRLTGLAALAVVQTCRELGLQPQIKWPNDVLLGGRKVAGILVESEWSGGALAASVVGIGLNVGQRAVPPPAQLQFPATSLETELGSPPARVTLLHSLVAAVLRWRAQLDEQDFIENWEASLAYRDQQVVIGGAAIPEVRGRLLGLEADGSLRIRLHDRTVAVHMGEISLRPGDDRMGETAR